MTEVHGKIVFGTPKSHSARTVPVPRFLRAVLEQQMVGKSPDDLVFTSPGRAPLRNTNVRRRAWNTAITTLGLEGLTRHDLRRTAASLAVDARANVKAVQRILGHASAAMALDVYADLFDESLDHVADRLHAAYEASRGPDAASMWPGMASNVVGIDR